MVMVSTSGTVFYQQTWLDAEDLAGAIDAYWAQGGEGIYTAAPLEKGPLEPASRPSDKQAQKPKDREPRAQFGKATP